MDGIDANILECGDPRLRDRFQSADMSVHSKAMPDSPAVAGFAFYVPWLLATASRRPDFHYLESVRIGAAGICG